MGHDYLPLGSDVERGSSSEENKQILGTIYVLDTSVLIHDPDSLKAFKNSKIVIPLIVIQEIDNLKTGFSPKSYAAREVARRIDEKRGNNPLSSFFLFDEENNIEIAIVSPTKSQTKKISSELDINSEKPDHKILITTIVVRERNPLYHVVLVTKDSVLRIVAASAGVSVEDYKKDKVSVSSFNIDPNTPTVSLSDEEKSDLIHFSFVQKMMLQIKVGSRVHIDDLTVPGSIVVYEHNQKIGHHLKLISMGDISFGNVKPKNLDQLYLMYILQHPAIKVVIITGLPGSGKTLLAMAAGVEMVLERGIFEKIVVMRPTVSLGEELGFLPGSLDEKLAPWMKPITDSLQIIFSKEDPQDGSFSEKGTKSGDFKIQDFFDYNLIEIAPITYLRGRNINNSFIYCDEAQNFNRHVIKSIVSRTGERSKLIIAGDLEQIDTPYLDYYSSGLTHLIINFSSQDIAMHIHLGKSERSHIADLAAKLL